jgi:outer membrane protein assembly factor BamB
MVRAAALVVAAMFAMAPLKGVPYVLSAGQWPQFRGPGAAGVSDSTQLPESWSTTKNVRWKAAIPGHGWSSPIAWGDRVFVTSVVPAGDIETPRRGLYFGGERPAPKVEHRWVVYAIDWNTGKIVWEREAHRAIPPAARHLKNTYASETPVTDGQRLYVSFGNVGLFAYDFRGTLLWSTAVPPKPMRNGWGTAASPVLHQGRLYVVNDNDAGSYLTAIDAATGRTIWLVERQEGTNWSTPYIWQHQGRTEIVTTGTGAVRSYGLDGELLWTLSPMSSIVIPTPFAKFDLLFVTSGYVGDQVRPVYAIRPGASGDISLKKGETSNASIAWSLPQGGPYNPSPIVYGDYYYTLFDRGFFTCHDAKTGREIYTKVRLDPAAGAFTASPWAYNGKLFAMSEDGVTYVIQAGPEFKLLARNPLDEFTMASPAIHRDSLVIRTASSVYRIQGSGIRDQGSGIRDQGSGIRDQGSGIRDQGSGIRDQGSELPDPRSLIPDP